MPKPGTANTLLSGLTTGVSTTPLIKSTQAPFNFATTPAPIGSNFNVATKQQNPINFGALQLNGQQQGAPTGLQQAAPQYDAISTGNPPQQGIVNPAFAGNGGSGQPPAYNPSFSGLVGQLGQAATQGSPQAQQVQQQLQSTAQGNIPIGQSAAQIAADYGQKIANVGQQGAAFAAGQQTTGTSPVASGNAAITAQTTAAQQQALATGEEAALQGTGQQLTAQQQAAAGLNQAGGLAYQGQGLVQQGLQQAGSLAQPQLSGIGTQQFYNPLNPGQTSGTPFSGGQVQGDVALGQQYAQNVSANNQAQAIKTNIQTYLAQNPTLNPSQFSDVNTALQFLNGKVSNPQYQTLSNYLQEYINTLAPILGVGGDTTNLKTQIANGFVNAAASGQSVSQVLDGIEQLAQAKLNAQQGGSGSTGGAMGVSNSTGSGGIYDF